MLGSRGSMACLATAAALLAGCGGPAAEMNQRLASLPVGLKEAVRDAVWAHGDPYNWTAQQSVLVSAQCWDYRHGPQPVFSRKVYLLDFKSRRLRIDDLSEQSIALHDGLSWRVFVRGQEMQRPTAINRDTIGFLAMLEYAAGEMRTFRLLFGLPFTLLETGVRLSDKGRVHDVTGAAHWNVAEASFDPGVAGFLRSDRLLVYFDPLRGFVDRVYMDLSDAPFYGIRHWGEWSDYRRLGNGLLLAHRWDFHVMDDQGQADVGRKLTVVFDRIAFNVQLPAGVFSNPQVEMPQPPREPVSQNAQAADDAGGAAK